MNRRHDANPRLKLMTINISTLRGKNAILENLIDEKDRHIVLHSRNANEETSRN